MAQTVQRTCPSRGSVGDMPGAGLLRTFASAMLFLQPVSLLHQPVCEILRDFKSLVFVQPMLDDQFREESAVHAPRHVVPSRNRKKGSRVVIKSYGIVEACRLRCEHAK